MAVKGLEQFGRLSEEIESLIDEASKDAIFQTGTKLIELLQQHAPDNSGQLQQSISALPIEQTNNGWVLKIDWEEYGTYQDAGVAGTKSGTSLGLELGYGRDFAYTTKMPPTNVSSIGGKSLAQLAQAKGVSPFALARSIFYHGIKAKKWATNTIESQQVQTLIDDIATLIVNQIK